MLIKIIIIITLFNGGEMCAIKPEEVTINKLSFIKVMV